MDIVTKLRSRNDGCAELMNEAALEIEKLRVSLRRCLNEAEGWLHEAHGTTPEQVIGYDGWAHEARRLLGDGQKPTLEA